MESCISITQNIFVMLFFLLLSLSLIQKVKEMKQIVWEILFYAIHFFSVSVLGLADSFFVSYSSLLETSL